MSTIFDAAPTKAVFRTKLSTIAALTTLTAVLHVAISVANHWPSQPCSLHLAAMVIISVAAILQADRRDRQAAALAADIDRRLRR